MTAPSTIAPPRPRRIKPTNLWAAPQACPDCNRKFKTFDGLSRHYDPSAKAG